MRPIIADRHVSSSNSSSAQGQVGKTQRPNLRIHYLLKKFTFIVQLKINQIFQTDRTFIKTIISKLLGFFSESCIAVLFQLGNVECRLNNNKMRGVMPGWGVMETVKKKDFLSCRGK